MSPIEWIAKGIHEGNWEDICRGYERLTGEGLPVPVGIIKNDDAEDALRKISNIISSVPIEPIRETEKPAKKKPGSPKGSKKKKKVTNKQLITNDPDPEEVEKNKIKAEKANKNKAKLNRQVVKKHEVECNECSNTFKSDRPSGEMGQKCPDCLSGNKDRFSS